MSSVLRFYVLTDTHFVSKELWCEGSSFVMREKGDQIALRLGPEILDSFFDIIIADKETNHVLITGDLVNCGEKLSHRDYKQKLKRLTDAGKRVYVTTATHDYNGMGKDENFFCATNYGKTENTPAEAVYKTELSDIYADYGINYADSVHSSGSYSVKMEDGFRLIAINDNGNGRSHCGLFEDGFEWLTNEIHKAKQNNEIVFLAVHHPVLPPWPVYKAVAEFEMFGGYEQLKKLMCDEGVHLIFTGHTHVQGIRKYCDDKGGYMYDVATSSLVSAFGKMRKVSIDSQTRMCDIKSVSLNKINGVELNGQSPQEFLYQLNFTGYLEKILPLAKTDWQQFLNEADGILPVDKMRKHKLLSKKAVKIADTLKMSTLAKFGKKYNKLTREQINSLKNELVKDKVFCVTRHVFAGNGPFPPQTIEYKVIMAAAKKADDVMSLVHKKINTFLPGINSVTELLEPMICNVRTGNDDEITIAL